LTRRPDDTLTFGVAYAKISPEVTGVDQDALAYRGPPYPVRHSETVFEVNYSAQIAPWWSIQPDLQYAVRPNGRQNADDPTLTVSHAFVAGVRSTIKS
jgi:porin